ncbi:hypothetical protein [Arthrobacter glacialis]|uniref:hypothetical protein n=1 Tax=Arthrobacter glacialis TaxID=1664 RepID=UPI001FAEA53D|nr:hypothetical protein [Arthrobacter glacialis]
MTQINGEPVEISTRIRPGEWTPESLSELVASYQHKLLEMGAPESEIRTELQQPEDGSASVRVSWDRHGVRTFADMGQRIPPESEVARGYGESIPADEATADSQGLGAVLGDAEWSAIDAPPTPRAMKAGENSSVPDVIIYTDENGKTYVEDASSPKEQ